MQDVPDTRELNLILDFCLRIGEMLLSSGAGAADVTATMRALSWHLGLRHADIDVTFTSLSMSYQRSPEEPAVLQVRQVKQRDIDYEDLTLVDHLVRDVLDDRADLDEARASLARIVSSGHTLPRWAVTLGWGLMCARRRRPARRRAVVVVRAFVAAVCIDRLQLLMGRRRRLPVFYRQVAGGAVATAARASLAAQTSLDVDPSQVVTANIIMLLAGVGFMGGLQDALSGFYVTAGARLTEALLATAGIIAGVSGGLTVADVAGVAVGRLDPGVASLESIPVMVVGGAVCGGAFAFASYAPRRIIAPVALVAGIALAIAETLTVQGFDRAWSVAMAALFVGLVSYTVAGRMRVPPLVVVVSAVVPMLPGLSIYRGLTLLGGEGADAADGLLAMATAASVAIALAAGVILGEYIAQPLKREARRLPGRLAGPRLVGPLRESRRRGR